ncbi:histidinol-phosphate transaminase [Lederbergia galactosidilytica]|uniref:Histidinol-phosphate aminotransferase n=1 Tax=Lederbergia galactosidilytica TaxID=217031 RepID=A0A177ZPX0_9BACI|nr:histidinol-phosphate transaminase [Lederbergia galactosidilytica]OAK69814.1 histidinol-phosphate aminotransferase [Lederbergia galactosidilytica]
MNVKSQLSTLKAYTPGKTTDEVKREYQLDKIVKLASNENPYSCSPNVLKAISQTDTLAIYPDGAAVKLKEAVAEHLEIDQAKLIFSSGLDELIQIISRAVLIPESNTVMASETFSQYRHHAIIEGAEAREIPLREGVHDLDKMAAVIDENTKLVWICNPNNPTGTYVPKQELIDFLDKVPNDVLVVVDEAYYEYVTINDYPQTIPLLDEYENLLVMRTFSKAYGLAGIRVGYGVANPALINKLDVVRLPFNTSTLAQTAAIAALEDPEFIEECVIINTNELQKYYQFFDQQKISYYPSQTNFIFLRLNESSIENMFQQLLEKGWIVRKFPNGIRITVGTEQENEELLNVLKEVIPKI